MFNRALFSSASGDWETPQELFDALDDEFGFDLDACATEKTTKLFRFFTPETNALEQDWTGTVFCNPPYGREIGRWVEKGYIEAQSGTADVVVMLLPSRTDTKWWHAWVMCADEIRFIEGRLRFSGHKNSAPFPSCIVVFRQARV